MVQHYEGELGVFDYDDSEFEIGLSLFNLIKNERKQSRYTVGEVYDLLLKKGFPEDVVKDEIIYYLRDQVLV